MSVLPVAEALDRLISARGSSCSCAVVDCRFKSEAQRLQLSLSLRSSELPPSALDIFCYLDLSNITQAELASLVGLRPCLITAPIPSELHDWVGAHSLLSEVVVDTQLSRGNTRQKVLGKARQALSMEVGRYCGQQNKFEPLAYNFAEEFPLDNPYLAEHFRVQRGSVRELLRTILHQNGIRVWCSIRRSGKTTSFSDLATEIGNAVIVKQTCDYTSQIPKANIFYDRLEDCFRGAQLPHNFLEDVVFSYCGSRLDKGRKTVFVLDEYETLFGRLRDTARRNEELRYTLAQPLFDQMVAFCRHNTIIFLGQRPDAYFVFNDQSQLSPYVRQDSFPLFQHKASRHSEFRELLQKVLQTRSQFDEEFANAVYEETSGHPFLTVKLLVDFVDWLIVNQRPANDLNFTGRDFQRFATARLTSKHISECKHYDLFHNYASSGLGEESQKKHPWLFAVYSILQRMAQDEPEKMSYTRQEFDTLVENLGFTKRFNFTSAYLLSSACQSNFLKVEGDTVTPGVRLLARISRICLPRNEA
jgi:hypothetical protein